jgi:arabinofuranan 3-O-arabinosyltransferase
MDVVPTVWVRARQGPRLADLVAAPGSTRATGDADLIDIAGSAYAAADGDPRTSWTASQSVVQYRSAPTLTLTLPRPAEVTALQITPSTSPVPTHPTLVAIDLGDGPQVRTLDSGAGTQTVPVRPRMTGTVRIRLLEWDDVIDRTALGFDQLKPPGLAEVTALGAGGAPLGAADAAANRSRRVDLSCGQGPVLAVSGRFVQTSVSTTVAALLSGDPVPARPCDPTPIALRQGEQELLISPGEAFITDGVQLSGPLADRLATAATTPADIATWSPARREISLSRSATARILVVPESVNPGWAARTPDGATLTPIVVNGWQQGWVVPGGAAGPVTLSFASNGGYRAGLIIGLALLPVLLALALVPALRRRAPDAAPRPWSPRWAAGVGILGAGTLIGGAGGLAVFGGALLTGYLLRHRQRLRDQLTLLTVPAGLITAGVLLSRYPWRSVDGYIGHSPWVQLPALIALGALGASLLTFRRADQTDTATTAPP